MKPKRVQLRINDLVLAGIEPRDRDRVLAAIERELVQHLGRGEFPRASRAAIVGERPRDPNPTQLGAHVARVIAKGGQR